MAHISSQTVKVMLKMINSPRGQKFYVLCECELILQVAHAVVIT